MNRIALSLCLAGISGGIAAGGMAACSSSSSPASSTGDAAVTGDGAVDAGIANFVPEIACTDTIASVYGDPGDVTGKTKGTILKCAHDMDLTAAQLTMAVDVADDAGNRAYSGPAFTSGAKVYRVLYRTERGDPNNTPGYSSALLLLPTTPRRGMGTALPALIANHGSRGQAGKCAPSMDNPAGQYVEEDFQHLVYPLVGLGFPVIAPDNAGYANFGAPGNPPPTYDDALDVGKSVLDGARAIRQVAKTSITGEDVLVGHSQGGYNTMAALALADSYGSGGSIKAVAVFSPLWFSQRTWAAAFAVPGSYPLASSAIGPVSLWYHYTHAYLLDGPDAATELFLPSKGPVVQSFVNNDCWSSSYPDLEDAGTSQNDFFNPTYISTTGEAAGALGGGTCFGSTPMLQMQCQTWIARMTADYPHLDGGATQVPILLWYANNDQTITPDAMQCVFNRLTTDKANYQVCYDMNPVGHGGVLAENAGYAVDWIAHETLPDAGAPAMGNCSPLAPNGSGVPQLLTGDGGVQKCNSLIPTE